MKDKIYLGAWAIGQLEEWIYFSASNINGLFRINIKTLEIEFVYRFQTVDLESDFFLGLHGGKIVFYKDELFLFPLGSNVIINFNTVTKRETTIEIPDFSSEIFAINEVVENKEEIIFKGDTYLGIYSLNLLEKQVKKSCLGEKLFSQYDVTHCGWSNWNAEHFCIVLQGRDEFLVVSKDYEEIISYPPEIKGRFVTDILFNKHKFWFMFGDSADIMCWNKEEQKVKCYKPIDSKLQKNISGGYKELFVFKDRVCILGNRYKGVYGINEKDSIVESVIDDADIFQVVDKEKIGVPSLGNFLIVNEELWVFPDSGKYLLIFNENMELIRKKEFSIETSKIPGWDSKVIAPPDLEETGTYTLGSYIRYILTQ